MEVITDLLESEALLGESTPRFPSFVWENKQHAATIHCLCFLETTMSVLKTESVTTNTFLLLQKGVKEASDMKAASPEVQNRDGHLLPSSYRIFFLLSILVCF